MSGAGISLEDLPGIYREEYLYAVELARGQHDPCSDWEGFRETLWGYLVRVFGLDAVADGEIGMAQSNFEQD